jgi:hypothetical protein
VNDEDHSGRQQRYAVEPDPAWDWSEEQNGELVVELSWPPDALAGRLEDLVVSPALAAALVARGLTGFLTSAASGVFRDDAFGIEQGVTPPPLLRLLAGEDPAQDVAYVPRVGLTVSARALDVLQAHCDRLQVETIDS